MQRKYVNTQANPQKYVLSHETPITLGLSEKHSLNV
jgi:hypothetical protein